MKGLRTAASFLTRLPVGAGAPGRPDLARAVPWFPIVGALLGLSVAVAYAGLRALLPDPLASMAAIGLGVLLTGAFHEDGLADVADALGGWSREESLRILKDPTHGTYGVLALVLSVGVRSAALAAMDGWTAMAVLPAAHALSRGAAVTLLRGPVVLGDGLGASYRAAVTASGVAAAAVGALLVALISMGAWALPAALAAAVGVAAIGALARRRFDGVTGDVLGAAQQVAETAVLLVGAATGGSGSPAWWR